ncbi:MAG: L-serine ammonia-lyase, iron-sulfur-dependent, subunit alpha [Bacillota bacterium]|nr:L-serine ammonia-lyase, iron-sulfur-dependent, subunit alpha [Bacillota bacterium]
MFKNIAELVDTAVSQGIPISEVMIQSEMAQNGKSREDILNEMAESFRVMKAAAQRGLTGVSSHSGMTGGDAKLLNDHIKSGRALTDRTFLSALCYALATNEVNAAMGLICATPTAGSCGVLPGVLLAAQEKLNKTDEDLVKALFCAGAIGFVIANNAMISGAAGGCQAEVGSASAMAAAALVELAGGSPDQSAQAAAIALKNMLGLACDPLAGLVEVPCIKRNAAGASNALAAAEMALAGIKSRVPPDEVIQALYTIGLSLPLALRETAAGGLAATPTGQTWKKMLSQGCQQED